MSIKSGEMSRIVCAIATRPKMFGALSAASSRATLRPSRYATDLSSMSRRPLASGRLTRAAALSTASAMEPAWCIMIDVSCRPSGAAATAQIGRAHV